MAFDFPPNPTLGQVFTFSNGYTYEWDGQKWRRGSINASTTELGNLPPPFTPVAEAAKDK